MARQPDQELGQVLVVIPTYNERDNIGKIVKRLHTALPDVHVLVVDDGSPDGTGQLADEMAAADERVHVMHRTEKSGLGAAYVAGFTESSDFPASGNGTTFAGKLSADGAALKQLHASLDRCAARLVTTVIHQR